MTTTFHAEMGDRGRIVVPIALREANGWRKGTPLLFVKKANETVIMSREEAKALVRAQMAGKPLLESLFEDRRQQAAEEDQGAS